MKKFSVNGQFLHIFGQIARKSAGIVCSRKMFSPGNYVEMLLFYVEIPHDHSYNKKPERESLIRQHHFYTTSISFNVRVCLEHLAFTVMKLKLDNTFSVVQLYTAENMPEFEFCLTCILSYFGMFYAVLLESKFSSSLYHLLREKYLNTEFFLVRIFPYSDHKKLRIWTLHTVIRSGKPSPLISTIRSSLLIYHKRTSNESRCSFDNFKKPRETSGKYLQKGQLQEREKIILIISKIFF